MNELEKIDFVLKALYISTKEKGMLNILTACKENGVEFEMTELKQIVATIKRYKFAVFQIAPKGLDIKGSIIQQGVDFVENDSFSNPGTSILKL